MQRCEKRCGFGGFRRGGENRFFVGLKDGKPRREILRVIRARLIGDAEFGAEKRGTEFGDQLLDCVGVIAETLAELAVAACGFARPVRQLVKDCRIVAASAGELVGLPMNASRGGN